MIRTEERAGQERRGDGQGQGPRQEGRRGGGGSQTQDATGQAADQASQTVENGGGGETPNATKAAEQKAEELGVDLSQVTGSGAEGRITVKDVTNAANRG